MLSLSSSSDGLKKKKRTRKIRKSPKDRGEEREAYFCGREVAAVGVFWIGDVGDDEDLEASFTALMLQAFTTQRSNNVSTCSIEKRGMSDLPGIFGT